MSRMCTFSLACLLTCAPAHILTNTCTLTHTYINPFKSENSSTQQHNGEEQISLKNTWRFILHFMCNLCYLGDMFAKMSNAIKETILRSGIIKRKSLILIAA